MTEIPSVDELISESRNEKKLNRKKKIIKVLLTLIAFIIISLSIYLYFNSSISKLNKVNVYGNSNISDNFISEKVFNSASLFSLLDFGYTLTKDVESNPLLKSIEFNYLSPSELDIYIEEYAVLAYLNDLQGVLIETGKLYSFNEFEPISLKELIYISGYDEEIEYLRLKDALIELDDSTKLMISEIIQEEKSYDKYYAKIIMYDGIIVYSSLTTLNVLDNYAAIRSALNPEHQCIAIDEIKAVPYSFSCLP